MAPPASGCPGSVRNSLQRARVRLAQPQPPVVELTTGCQGLPRPTLEG